MLKLVVYGAHIKCNYGSATREITPCMAPTVVTGPGHVAATMFDYTPGVHLQDFGTCHAPPKPDKPCKPITPLPWAMEWTAALVSSGGPAISEQSTLRCFRAGDAEISIQYSGQETIYLLEEQQEEKENDDSGSSILKEGASIGLDLIPGVGTGKGIIEGIIGKDVVTGEPLGTLDRVIGVIPAGKYAKHGFKGARKLAGLADEGGKPKRLPSKIHQGAQDKHIPGRNNYQPGRSIMRHKNPQELLDRFGGKGDPANGVTPGEPGYRERVDFGEVIGDYVIDKKTGESVPTTKGMIHYNKNSAHIVPSEPTPNPRRP